MKFLIITTIALAIFTSSTKEEHTIGINAPAHKDLYVCAYFPMCDHELNNPVSKPKDTKTETQDVKDEKLA